MCVCVCVCVFVCVFFIDSNSWIFVKTRINDLVNSFELATRMGSAGRLGNFSKAINFPGSEIVPKIGFLHCSHRLPNTKREEVFVPQKPTQKTKPQQVFGKLGFCFSHTQVNQKRKNCNQMSNSTERFESNSFQKMLLMGLQSLPIHEWREFMGEFSRQIFHNIPVPLGAYGI